MVERDSHTNTDIEVLRAIAVTFTLVAHLIWGVVPKLGGLGREIYPAFVFWTGVDLFFAISGFVITASLLRAQRQFEEHTGTPARRDWGEFLRFARPFWIRRVFRLLPSAWLWVVITVVLAASFNRYGSLGPLHLNIREGIAALLNISNFYYYDWFSQGNTIYGSLGVYWSLSLEEQFYLLFPLVLFFIPPRWTMAGVIALFVAQFSIARPNGFELHQASLLWFVRTDALALGVLIAFWQSRASYSTVEPRALRHPALGLGTLAIGTVLLAAVPAFAGNPLSTGIVALISGGLVLIASYDRNYLFPPSRLKRLFVWIGSRSYSIYLIHTTGRAVMLELKHRFGVPGGSVAAAAWSAVALIVILVVAELNYRFIEKPFRRLGRHIANKYRREPARVPLNEPARAIE